MSPAPNRVVEIPPTRPSSGSSHLVDGSPCAPNPLDIDALHGALEAAGLVQAAGEPEPKDGPPEAAAAKPGSRRQRRAELTVRDEPRPDYDLTAALASEGFGFAPGTFKAEALRWLYERAFGEGTTVLAAWAGDRKVGQIALVHQSLAAAAGPTEPAVALVDLFILKAFRSRAAMAALYGAVEAFCRERGIRFIVAVPNENAAGVNTRYLQLAEAAKLEIRVGLAGLPQPWTRVDSHRVADLDPARGRDILGAHCGGAGTGLVWTGERLWERLQKPGAGYALHAGRDLLLVSAPRRQGRAPHTMLCALLARPGTRPGRGAVSAVVSAACRLHGRPLFVYAGINAGVPLPGVLLPARLRPSPMILQMRDFRPEAPALAISRFEALDFDFV